MIFPYFKRNSTIILLQTLQKKERLYEENIIHNLFEKGSSFYISPFKILYINIAFNSCFPAKILISVPYKNFKKAVQRNYLKRLIKEAYRKNKNILYDSLNDSNNKIAFMILYTGKIIMSYSEIENKIILILQRLVKENEKIIK